MHRLGKIPARERQSWTPFQTTCPLWAVPGSGPCKHYRFHINFLLNMVPGTIRSFCWVESISHVNSVYFRFVWSGASSSCLIIFILFSVPAGSGLRAFWWQGSVNQGEWWEGGSPGPGGPPEIHDWLHSLCVSAHLRGDVLLKERSFASCHLNGISEWVCMGLWQGFPPLALLAFLTGSFSVVGTILCPVGSLAGSLASTQLPLPIPGAPFPEL